MDPKGTIPALFMLPVQPVVRAPASCLHSGFMRERSSFSDYETVDDVSPTQSGSESPKRDAMHDTGAESVAGEVNSLNF